MDTELVFCGQTVYRHSLGTNYTEHLTWRQQADVVATLRNTSNPLILQFFEQCGPSVMMLN